MKPCLTLSAFLVAASLCAARPVAHWTYAKLTADADLVVIATPTAAEDKDKTVLPNVQRVGTAQASRFRPLASRPSLRRWPS